MNITDTNRRGSKAPTAAERQERLAMMLAGQLDGEGLALALAIHNRKEARNARRRDKRREGK